MSDCTACGVPPPSRLKSLWGLADPDLRLCPRCGEWFAWSSDAPNAGLTRLERPTALVMEELLSGTGRPREALEQAVALVEQSLLAALIDQLKDDALAPLLEHVVAWLPTADGALATALAHRLAAAARSPRFNATLGALLARAPSSPRTSALIATGLEASEALRLAAPLSSDEVADFWALGVSLEASWVPDDEWARAIDEGRVQEVSSYSSMGTAETGWVRCSSLATRSFISCAACAPAG
jgi:hypothetical protein